MRCNIAGVLVTGLLLSGCGKPIPGAVKGPNRPPQIGWVIMSGDADNPDRDFVCQSNPPGECVMPADRPDARVLAHVYFYYHPAATETRYSGTNRIGFFNQPLDVAPKITVKPGDRAGNQSISGYVSSKPGLYTLAIAVEATSTTTGEKQDIRGQIPVSVK
jgi:hypothetical protein